MSPRDRSLVLPLALLLGCLAASPPPQSGGARGGTMQMNDITVQTQETDSNENTGDFRMPYAVRFRRPGSDAVADHATGNAKRGTIVLIGHVVVHDTGNAAQSVAGAQGGNEPSTITCDRLEVDSRSKRYTAIGNVHFSQGQRSGTAQRGVLDRLHGTLHLEGAVTLSDPQSTLTANAVDDNLVTKDVVITGSPAVLRQLPSGGAGRGAPASGAATDSVQSAEIHYNENSGDYTMPRTATFTRPGTDATGDHAAGNSKRGTLTLTGNVVVHDSGNAPEARSDQAYGRNGPATLTCDTLDVDARRRVYTAVGNVHFTQGADRGEAQRGVLDRGANLLHLEGAVKLAEADSTMTAQSVDYNLATKDVKVLGSPIIITQPAPTPAPKPAATPKPKSRKHH